MRYRTWIAGAALMLAAAPVAAQDGGGWAAWQGCWATTAEDAPSGELLCVAPGADAQSVRMITVRGGVVVDETAVRADGVERPVVEGGCSGTEVAEFSADRRRVYTRSEMDCDGVRRTSSGVLAMVSEVEWVDAQALDVGGNVAVRSARYRVAATPALVVPAVPAEQRMVVESARLAASAPLTPEAVVEASSHVATPAVEAFLAARQQGFALNANRLLALRDAGVEESTIDLMVALSYPQKFAVRERAVEEQRGDVMATSPWYGVRGDPRYGASSCFDVWGYPTYADSYCSSVYRNMRLGYSPYGYGTYGWNRYDRDTPVIVIVDPRTLPGNPDDDQGGRVVKGRGYTSSGATRGTAGPRSTPSSTTSTGSVRSTPAASTSPTTSSGSSTPVRTAKPKPDTKQ